MRTLEEILDLAIEHKGSLEAINAMMSQPISVDELAATPDDRWLAEITKNIFRAGFNWKVVEAMWPGFEEAFNNFDIGAAAMMTPDDLDRLVSDKRIIRYGAKIRSVQENAIFLSDLKEQHGTATGGEVIARWPATDQIGLMQLMKKRATRLGGNTGQYMLRFMGKDSFILSGDVIKALIRENVIEKAPTSKKALSAVQESFNNWAAESGRSMTEISRILAMSVG